MKSVLLLIACSALIIAGVADSKIAGAQSDSTAPLLSLCDNLRADLTKEVRVRAIYRVGFEWSELYSLKCPNAPRVWVNFSDDWKGHTEKAARKQLGRGEGTYGLTFIGIIGGSGGHMGAFPMTLRVTSVETATRFGKESVLPHALSPKVRRRVESFEAPANRIRPTNRWTRAAGACFVTCVVRRRVL